MSRPPNPWLPLRAAHSAAGTRLFCFPFAGGGAAAFRSWQAALGPSVDVCAVEYPGRLSRHGEPALRDLMQLATAIAAALGPLLAPPFAFFGYSYGALVAYEVARVQRAAGRALPDSLIVGARIAPHLSPRQPDVHQLPDAGFLDAIDRRYEAIPQVVRNEPELLAMMVPPLRADMTALERYRHRADAPLACPIHALGGSADPLVDERELHAWAEHTDAGFRAHVIEGGHFFMNTNQARVLQLVHAALADGRSI